MPIAPIPTTPARIVTSPPADTPRAFYAAPRLAFRARAVHPSASPFFPNLDHGGSMLTLQDCLGFCELTEDEVLAIAEHEHLTEMAALELGSYLVCTPEGERRIESMIVDDIDAARARGDLRHAAMLRLVLQRYVAAHAPG
jgi:hypothetical protein